MSDDLMATRESDATFMLSTATYTTHAVHLGIGTFGRLETAKECWCCKDTSPSWTPH